MGVSYEQFEEPEQLVEGGRPHQERERATVRARDLDEILLISFRRTLHCMTVWHCMSTFKHGVQAISIVSSAMNWSYTSNPTFALLQVESPL